MAQFTEYQFKGKIDPFCEKLHEAVVYSHDHYFDEPEVQELLTNKGLELEERANSFFDIFDVRPMPRNIVLFKLKYLRSFKEICTAPQVLNITTPVALDPQTTVQNQYGWNLDRIETYQRAWVILSEISAKVEALETCLTNAFTEFNYQFILSLTATASRIRLLHEHEPTHNYQKLLKEAYSSTAQVQLDNAYYNLARSYFFKVELFEKELKKNVFGEKFIFPTEQIIAKLIEATHAQVEM